MRSGLGVLGIVAFLMGHLLAQEPKPEDLAKKDQEALQGTWELDQLEVAGKKMTAEEVKKAEGKITIAGTAIIFVISGKDPRKGTLTLDASKTPRWIDLEDAKKSKELGIYEITGDSFKLCATRAAGERPKEFASKTMPESYLMVFKRTKKE